MRYKAFLAEIQSDFSRDFEAGLIDEHSVLRWTLKGLRRFGQNVMTLKDQVVFIENGTGKLNDDFYSLKLALKCEADEYTVEGEESKLIASNFWTERVESKTSWTICDPTTECNSESKIVENLYYDDTKVTFRYKNPVKLKLGKSMQRSACADKCLNRYRSNCPHEITINGNTIYTNFSSGIVYLQYYGVNTDEEGYPIIPDNAQGKIDTYLEYHVKKRIIEQLLSNGDDVKRGNLLSYYREMERDSLIEASTSIKFETLSPRGIYKLGINNRKETLKYELMFPVV